MIKQSRLQLRVAFVRSYLCVIGAIPKASRTPASQVAYDNIYDAAEGIHIGIAEVIPNFPQMTPSDYS